MQPLAYFAVRSLLGWLQFVERSDRAFVGGALLLVATGAAHCWAVVYALFISIHTRAMRYDGYHEGYTEHLPVWVSWTETLAMGSMGIWWAACFTTAAIRILDDDADALPSERRDLGPGALLQFIRSPRLQDALHALHTVSCVGLFASIVPLCITMAVMKGTITTCELCLAFVAIGFALPHAAVAFQRLNWASMSGKAAPLPAPAAEAAAREAAALGPQLCVILALADSPGHAYLWQNFVYLVSAVAFVAAVAACGRSPPKVGDAALPPETPEFLTCIVLDVVAAVSLIVCFPHLNTWHLWALAALLVALFAAVWFPGWRDLFVDFLDPLFVIRSDTDKMLPGPQRQRLRRVAWLATLACAAVALGDILLHPVEEGLFEPPVDFNDVGSMPDIFNQNALLMLRWKAQQADAPGEQQMLALASEALEVEKDELVTQAMYPQHRLLLFKFNGTQAKGKVPVHLHWKAFMMSPKGKLADLAESLFPGTLNVTACLQTRARKVHLAKAAAAAKEGGDSQTSTTTLPPDPLSPIVGPSEEAQKAYEAGCEWWAGQLHSFAGTDGKLDEEGAGGAGDSTDEGEEGGDYGGEEAAHTE
mmetsp:Transcript_111995/g.349024  ORF Transcript_111995/g.349024 Transcript_111995/m.349024 type:complete len:591 (-) Transcript_111995:5-1777(-)